MISVIIGAVAVSCIAVLARIRAADTRRLNFLERTRAEIDTDGPGFVIYGGDESTQLGGGMSRGSYKTLRAAVDAAMRANVAISHGGKEL